MPIRPALQDELGTVHISPFRCPYQCGNAHEVLVSDSPAFGFDKFGHRVELPDVICPHCRETETALERARRAS